jgi:hypothetical protein
MPSQQTICQICGALVATAEMPEHVRIHADREELFDRAHAVRRTVAKAVDSLRAPTSFERAKAAIAALTPEQQHDVQSEPRIDECSCMFHQDGSVSTPCPEMLRIWLMNEQPRGSGFAYESESEARTAHAVHARFDVSHVEQPSPEHMQRGDAIATLLDAVTAGATLEIQGPTISNREVRAFIESATGARGAQAHGTALGPVLVELANGWKRSSTIPSPPHSFGVPPVKQ